MSQFRLKEICDFNKTSVTGLNHSTIIKYLDTSNLVEEDIIELQEIELQKAPSRAKRLVLGATILYSLVRPNLCHYGFISNPVKNLVASTGFITINLKKDFEEVIDIRYVYLLLTQNKLTDYLHTIAKNAVSAYPSLNPSDIENLLFEFPPLEDQRAITSAYFNISNKIAINREINRNLVLAC